MNQGIGCAVAGSSGCHKRSAFETGILNGHAYFDHSDLPHQGGTQGALWALAKTSESSFPHIAPLTDRNDTL